MKASFFFVTSLILKGICTNAQRQSVMVHIKPAMGSGVDGQLQVTGAGSGVTIRGQITGLTAGLHGFHIHEKGSVDKACKDAGGHFNPFKKPHGGQNDLQRHVGDLGNIEADLLGIANVDIYDNLASFDPLSEAYIGQRTLVVHFKPDDLGQGSNDESKIIGNSGVRIGCGVIDMGESPSSANSLPTFSPTVLLMVIGGAIVNN